MLALRVSVVFPIIAVMLPSRMSWCSAIDWRLELMKGVFAGAACVVGRAAEATFTAPVQRGDYQFICTFPGHFAVGMKGVLTVK